MKKRFLFSFLLILDIIYLILLLLSQKNEYLYSKFTFSIKSFLINVGFLIFLNIILISILVWCGRRVRRLIFVGGAAVLLSAWFLTTLYTFTALGVFWQSETRDFENFDRVDEHLDSQLSVAGLKISDIIEMDIEKVDNFYYSSRSQLGCEKFAFVAEIHLSNQEYDELKLTFSTAKEFKEKTFSLQEQQTFNMTGFYEFNTDVPPYESSTTVDFWDTMIIRFCDSEKKFSLDWQGVCYT